MEDLAIIGRYWDFFEPRFWEEDGEDKQVHIYKK
jgi:hypothetical protein